VEVVAFLGASQEDRWLVVVFVILVNLLFVYDLELTAPKLVFKPTSTP
jgi:hypothetical protein